MIAWNRCTVKAAIESRGGGEKKKIIIKPPENSSQSMTFYQTLYRCALEEDQAGFQLGLWTGIQHLQTVLVLVNGTGTRLMERTEQGLKTRQPRALIFQEYSMLWPNGANVTIVFAICIKSNTFSWVLLYLRMSRMSSWLAACPPLLSLDERGVDGGDVSHVIDALSSCAGCSTEIKHKRE